MGRPRASALTPLASDASARVLATIILTPGDLHVRAISDRSQLSYSVVQREVDRLETAGLVTTTKLGAARVVRANDRHPLFPELRALLLKTHGPRELLAELLHGETGVDEAYIYGSWAARYHGQWGGPPADVDVLIVGHVTPARREELEAAAEDALGQPVQVEVVPPEEWEAEQGAFVRTVKGRPLVEIPRIEVE